MVVKKARLPIPKGMEAAFEQHIDFAVHIFRPVKQENGENEVVLPVSGSMVNRDRRLIGKCEVRMTADLCPKCISWPQFWFSICISKLCPPPFPS
jgi:hypothetical protein